MALLAHAVLVELPRLVVAAEVESGANACVGVGRPFDIHDCCNLLPTFIRARVARENFRNLPAFPPKFNKFPKFACIQEISREKICKICLRSRQKFAC